jgi:hypothetical protein
MREVHPERVVGADAPAAKPIGQVQKSVAAVDLYSVPTRAPHPCALPHSSIATYMPLHK